jgi:hypothetical protein
MFDLRVGPEHVFECIIGCLHTTFQYSLDSQHDGLNCVDKTNILNGLEVRRGLVYSAMVFCMI